MAVNACTSSAATGRVAQADWVFARSGSTSLDIASPGITWVRKSVLRMADFVRKLCRGRTRGSPAWSRQHRLAIRVFPGDPGPVGVCAGKALATTELKSDLQGRP